MEQVALSGGQSGSECVEYSVTIRIFARTERAHIVNYDGMRFVTIRIFARTEHIQ